jgi:hypothetical protein
MAAFGQLMEAAAKAALTLLLGFGVPATVVLLEKRLELSLLARRQQRRLQELNAEAEMLNV